MEISVTDNFKDAERWLGDIGKKQLPFATSLALNKTASRCRDAIMTEMLHVIDRPTPFTMEAFKVKNSSKRNLTAWLLAKPIQAEYLYEIVYGGTETKKHAVPGGKAKLNAFGNLPRTKTKTMARNRKKFFYGIPKGLGGTKGWYQRSPANPRSQAIHLVASFPKKRSYKPLLHFEKVVERGFNRWFSYEWGAAFDRAMRTAR